MDGSLIRAFIMPLNTLTDINDMSDVSYFEDLTEEKEFEDGN